MCSRSFVGVALDTELRDFEEAFHAGFVVIPGHLDRGLGRGSIGEDEAVDRIFQSTLPRRIPSKPTVRWTDIVRCRHSSAQLPRGRIVNLHRIVNDHSVDLARARLRNPSLGDVMKHPASRALGRWSVTATAAADRLDRLAVCQGDLRTVRQDLDSAVESAFAMPRGTATTASARAARLSRR